MSVVGNPVRRRVELSLRYAVLIVLAIVFLLPLYVMVKTAVSQPEDVTSKTFVWWPADPNWGKFAEIFTDERFGQSLVTSAIMAVSMTVGQIIIGALAGYGLARIPNRASKPLLALTVTMLLIPSATTFLPNYLIVSWLGWTETLQGIVVPTLFTAFNVFLFRQFFLSFPKELEEAGKLDGLGYIGTFLRVVLPNSLAFASALTVLGFLGAWNAFLWPLVVAGTGFGALTVQVYLSSFITAQTFDYTGLFAAGFLASIPVLLVFILLQRWLLRGVAETGLGGS